MTLQTITTDVATTLGESLVLECETEESPFPDFTSRVRLLATDVLTRLLLESPKIMLSGWKPFGSKITIDEDEGVATLPLPEDYLRLGSIRLSGWSKSVEETLPAESPRFAGRGCRLPGINPDKYRPAAEEAIAADGTMTLRLYGATAGDTLISATYMPLPAIHDEQLEVPQALYSELISRIAEKMKD